ncbi:superfamily II DNA or RNA helicase/HKD family nuclease [Oikeobacillus pervagus]|uniref:Superfamily II DNA or RNA helicase/HKD family nuclease n=1 Tax=Oikeobacillus pervagus TaxID=1325931 RepID=A0AAJ1T3Q6_9BACI|nr:DEAD/DEAH box helicase [Oikeobacillus pervagus]MDQ0215349.1 superfamily II DNA or RNA helicase/HKD family nuclease [Oikeobacillus pervagus]
MENFIGKLEASLHKGFIDHKYTQSGNYKPRLLINHSQKNENVLTSLLEELESCESFLFSVAFITESGLATLKSHFLDLKRKGIKGRILTSTFLNFNQPKMFKELMKIKNVEVRLTDLQGFHSKGYIFQNKTHYSLIVGSSNLTAHALKVNYEWNVKLTSHENGEIVHHFKNQFEEVWKEAEPLSERWIENYKKTYKQITEPKLIDRVVELPIKYETNSIKEALEIVPNKMQQAALKEIQAVRDAGEQKGLVISATGTGKTYLSAFDVRRFAPRRMLFIVHREQILKKAQADYKKVLGGYDKDFGILSGSNRQTDAKYLFATIQTISKEENLQQFHREEFDYILIDEVHKAGASSYQKVMEYFQPKFLLGMTATPERTDDFNIYELFDYNIAYEIRLQEALEEDMLCPFHYFGVTDWEWNGEMMDETTLLSKLVTEERVQHILEKVEYYGFSGEEVKGLIFCSRKEEAKQLSQLFNQKGFRTVALTGEDSQEVRESNISKLENGELDYILTVDIFNEGIDIPSINQVVMLRQTQSSIIFIQQLGRGLRKHSTKDYVTIIDFIGNYKKNYLIPIALSGDRSQNKDRIRRKTNDTSFIKGVSTINFEEIAKKRIFSAIDQSNLTTLKILKEAYVELKNRLGRIPYLYDFLDNHSLDPVVVATKYHNYYQFLLKMKEDLPLLSSYENKVLTMLSLEILNGKRKHEIILLELLLEKGEIQQDEYIRQLVKFRCRIDSATLESVKRVLDLSFFTQSDRKKYGEKPLVTLNSHNIYAFCQNLQERLKANDYFRHLIEDIVRSAKEKSKLYKCEESLTLYEKYSRKDVCKLLNWPKDESSTVYGYKTKDQTCPIFITYHKQSDVEASVNYEDEFLSQDVLKWYTRSNRTLKSEEVKKIIYAEDHHIDIHIFVKKDDDEGKDFYYLGKAKPDQQSVQQDIMKDENKKPVVHMNMIMEKALDPKLYQYIKSS